MSSTPPKHSLSSPTAAPSSSSPALPTPSSSSSASEVTKQLRRELEQQIAEKEKQLQDSTSGIGRSVLARQISKLKERLQEMDRRQQLAASSSSSTAAPHQQQRLPARSSSPLRRAQSPSSMSGDDDLSPTTLEKLQKLERDIGSYRALSPNLSSHRKDKLRTGLEPLPSPSTSTMLPPAHGHDSTSLLPLPPPPTGSTPTKRRSKVPNTDRRNNDIEFATEIGQGLLIEVRKMQAVLQEKDDQLKALQAAKADLERAAESMAKQLRLREENEEKLKEETWNLELAKQELTISVSELQQNLNRANAEQKKMQEHMDELTGEIEQLRDREEKLTSSLEAMKQRHEQDMGTLRRHSAGLQREKADFIKQVEALSSELAIAKAQSRIAKRSHSELSKPSAAAATDASHAQSNDASDASKDNATSGSDTGSVSPKQPGSGAPRNQALEVETLKTSLAHAHRMVSNLRSNLHREKTEKFELKKLLSESQEAIEQLQNDPRLWVDAGYRGSGNAPDSNGSSSTRRTRKGKRRVPVSKTRVARPMRGEGDASDADERRKRKDSQVTSSYSLTSGESEDDDDDYYDEDDLTMAAGAGAVAGAGLASLGSELSKSQQRDNDQVGRSLGDELSAAFSGPPPPPQVSQSDASMQTDSTEKEPVQLQQMTLDSFDTKPVVAEERHVQCEPPQTADAETQSHRPEYVDHSVQHQGNPMVDSAAQCDVAVTQDQGIQSEPAETCDALVQSEAPSVEDAFVQSEAPNVQDVFVQSEAPSVHDVFVQSEAAESHDVSVQSEAPKVNDISVQSEVPESHDASVQFEAPETHDMSVQHEAEPGVDMSTQSDTAEYKDTSVQYEATAVMDTGVQAEPADVTDATTQMDAVEAKDIHVQYEPVFEAKEAFVQSEPADIKDMHVQCEPAAEYKDSAAQSDAVNVKDIAVQYESLENKNALDASVQVDLVRSEHSAAPEVGAGAFGLGALAAAAFGKWGGAKAAEPANAGDGDREIKPSSPAATDGDAAETQAKQEQLKNAVPAEQNMADASEVENNPLDDANAHAATPVEDMKDTPVAQTEDEDLPSANDAANAEPEPEPEQQPLSADSAMDLPSQNDENAKVYSKAETDALIAAAVAEAMAKAQQQQQPQPQANGAIPATREVRNKPSLADLAAGATIQQQADDREDIPARPCSPPPAHLLSRVAQSPTPSLSTSSVTDKGKAPARNAETRSIGSASQQLHNNRPSSIVSSLSASEPRASIGSSAYDTASLRAYADPHQVGLITQTMIGDWMWKYTRKSVGGGLSENRHRRFFWIHPYTRTLYWSTRAPGTHGSEIKAKSALIEGVSAEPDYTQPPSPGVPNVSLLVRTTNRVIKLTAPTMARHQVWLDSLNYLLSRPADAPAASLVDDRRTNGSASLSINNNQGPIIRRQHSAQNMFRTAAATQPRDLDDDDDFEDEAIEDVRMCCDGKHHVSKLERDHIHHRPYYRKRQSRQAKRASTNTSNTIDHPQQQQQQRAAAY